jgi:hypothetical protein
MVAQDFTEVGNPLNSNLEVDQRIQFLLRDLDITNKTMDSVVSKVVFDQSELSKEQFGMKVKINFLEIGFFTLLGIFFGGLGYSI